MGGNFSCFRDTRNKQADISINFSKEDLNRIIFLQSLLRGYVDRRKAVEFSKLKYSKKSKARDKKSQK